MGIIFLLTLLQILIWGKKVLTLCQKMHFFWQNNTFSFRNCKMKRFRFRFLKTMHILFLFTSLGQLRQHKSYFVHFQPKTKDIPSFWVFLTFFSSLRWNLRIPHCFPGMIHMVSQVRLVSSLKEVQRKCGNTQSSNICFLLILYILFEHPRSVDVRWKSFVKMIEISGVTTTY